MSGRGPRGVKASKWGTEETSRGPERFVNDRFLVRKGVPGLIFMCNSKTKRDCFLYKVLGLTLAKRELVEQIVPGTFLFLFDIDVRELHGIYEASSHGGINLEPLAFQGQGSYPAQVRFTIYRECLPLPEQVFKTVIQENYFAWNKFNHELTSDQVSKLMQLFHPIEAPRKRLLVESAADALNEAGGHRLDLLGRALPVTGSVQLADRVRVPAPFRLEGLQRRELGVRQDAHPLVADAVDRRPLPQTRVLDGRHEQKDLLGSLEEVDQLALKYLQSGNPGASRALNPLHRNAAAAVSSLQQEAILRNQALETERVRRVAVDQARFREHGSSLPGASSSHISPFTAARVRAMAIPRPLRHAADIRRRW